MGEYTRLAFRGIWSHKMRSALTMLGIIIGIASIIAIVSTIKGTNEQIKENLIGAGNNVITVQLCQDGNPLDFQYEQPPAGVSVLSEDVRRQLLSVRKTLGVSLYTQRGYADSVFYQNTSFSGQIVGADKSYMDVYGYCVTRGRPFSDQDYERYHRVVLLDETAASSMFASEDPVGQIIEIQKVPFTVIGLYAPQKSSSPVINNLSDYYMYSGRSSGTVIMPNAVWPEVYRFDEPQSIALRAETTDDMTKIGQRASDILNASLPQTVDTGKYSYKSQDQSETAQQLQELSASSNKQLIWIASISLIVGAIGVMNIMLVSVTERTREIGLKKALGAKRSSILGQFLTEAAVLTFIGGLIGVGGGIVMAKVISLLTGTPTAISIPAIAAAVLLSVVIGLISGVFPAVKAADLNPIDALRRD